MLANTMLSTFKPHRAFVFRKKKKNLVSRGIHVGTFKARLNGEIRKANSYYKYTPIRCIIVFQKKRPNIRIGLPEHRGHSRFANLVKNLFTKQKKETNGVDMSSKIKPRSEIKPNYCMRKLLLLKF